MSDFDAGTLLLQLGVLLCVAFLLGRLAERVGLPATTGELATGLVLGPSVVGALTRGSGSDWLFAPASGHTESLRAIALFCGVLLIGIAGATVDLPFVQTQRRTIGLVSLGALGLPLVFTTLLAFYADVRLRGPAATASSFAAFAGLALSVSAVPVIVKVFADLGILHRNLSKVSLSVAVLDDAAVWVGLAVLAGLTQARQLGGDELLVVATAAVALTLLALVARRWGDFTAQSGDHPARGAATSCLAAVGVIMLGAVITDGAGLDSTLGAFLGGMVIATGRLVPVATLRALRTVVLGVLAPLFLAVSGLSADLTVLRDPRLAAIAAGALILAVVSKSLGAYGGGRLAGLGHLTSMAVACALNARGTVQLVVAAAGLRLGLISTEAFTILVLVALVTSAMAGPLIRRYLRQLPETPEESQRAGPG